MKDFIKKFVFIEEHIVTLTFLLFFVFGWILFYVFFDVIFYGLGHCEGHPPLSLNITLSFSLSVNLC